MTIEKLECAIEEYKARQKRSRHPDGRFDGGGRWYPSQSEEQECCLHIRQPSRAYPYSLLTHCRTIQHIAELYSVDKRELKDAVREVKREGGDNYFKLVAIHPESECMTSIFDGETTYQIDPGNNKLRQARFSLPEAMSLLYSMDILIQEPDDSPW